MPGDKGGKTKHDRCVEGVKESSPGVDNPHAVCVAQGVRPSSWKKDSVKKDEDELREQMKRNKAKVERQAKERLQQEQDKAEYYGRSRKQFDDKNQAPKPEKSEKPKVERPSWLKVVKNELIKFNNRGQWSIDKMDANGEEAGGSENDDNTRL